MTVPAVFFQCERCGYVPSLNVMIVDDVIAILDADQPSERDAVDVKEGSGGGRRWRR